MPDLWTLEQPDAIERKYPTREVRALVAEIRRLNVIAVCAGDLVASLESASLLPIAKLRLMALGERLAAPATGCTATL